MNRGHSAAWDQQWDKAIAYYRAALTEFPDDTAGLTALGFALFQADRLDDALGTYQRAATLSPGDPVAPEKCGEIFERLGRVNEAAQTYLVVAEIHIQRRDIQKAIDNWNRVVRLTPDNLNAHSRLALALERTSQPHAAALEYVEVARIFQRAREVDKAGQALQRAAQLDAQMPELREAAEKLKRNQPIPAINRQAVKRGTDMLSPEALAEVEAVKTPPLATGELSGGQGSPLIPAKEVALASLAELLFEEDADTSKLSTSVNALTRGSGMFRDSQSQRAQAIMFLGQAINSQSGGNAEAAASNYEAALDAGLEHPLIHFMLGALYLDLRRPPDAIDHFQAAIAREDIKLGVLFGLGEAYRQTSQSRQALTYLLEALKRLDLQLVPAAQQDRLAEAYESLAESLARVPDEEAAKIVPGLRRFLSGDGWEERARHTRRQLDANADGGQVTALAEEVATPGTDQVIDAMRHIDDYVRRRLYATAMEEAFWALEHSPTYLPVHVRMAEILVAENKPEAAATKYKVIANTYQIRGEAGRAARLLGQVLKINPVDIQAREQLIRLLIDQGKSEDALTQFVDLADTFRDLADLDTAREKYAEALKYAQSAGARNWSVRLLHALGDIDMQRLAWREALRGYEQIKAIAPSDDKARIALVDLHFRLANQRQAIAELDGYLKQLISQRNLAPAATLLEELLNNHPDDPALIARLARVYQDQGRKADAITRYDQLGDLQLQSGQRDQALETIRTILTLGPDDPAPYQQLLSQLQSS